MLIFLFIFFLVFLFGIQCLHLWLRLLLIIFNQWNLFRKLFFFLFNLCLTLWAYFTVFTRWNKYCNYLRKFFFNWLFFNCILLDNLLFLINLLLILIEFLFNFTFKFLSHLKSNILELFRIYFTYHVYHFFLIIFLCLLHEFSRAFSWYLNNYFINYFLKFLTYKFLYWINGIF